MYSVYANDIKIEMSFCWPFVGHNKQSTDSGHKKVELPAPATSSLAKNTCLRTHG